MGFDLEVSVPALTVFVQGLLSFFSPCVLPLVPLYVSYLAGGTGTVGEDGVIRYPRKKVLVNTVFFVLGVALPSSCWASASPPWAGSSATTRPGLPGSAASLWCSSAYINSGSSERPPLWSGSTGFPSGWTDGP